MDEIAEAIARTSVKAATVQGAATGVGGVFTLAADIPAMLGLSLKTPQDIAVAYGFDPKDKKNACLSSNCSSLHPVTSSEKSDPARFTAI